MIITDVTARNILKYATLELHDLPEKGLIAIDGPNESGKSSIGETICFALFGRTYSLEPGDLEKLIRWGEGHCSASVRFRSGDGGHYEVARFLDRDGNQGARLNRVGEEEPLARGTEAVDNELYNLLGYGYEEFIESFYLAQREITTPHPHSYAVKAMAGISTLEYVDGEYREEIGQIQRSLTELAERRAAVEQEVEGLALDPERLPALQQERDRQAAAESMLNHRVADLEQASSDYQDAWPRVRAARRARGRAGLLRLLSLLLAAVLLAAWGLLTRYPEHPLAGRLNGWLSAQLPAWGEQYLPWLLYAGIGFALLFLLAWFRIGALKGRIRRLQEKAAGLAGQLEELYQSVAPKPDGEPETAAPAAEGEAEQETPAEGGEAAPPTPPEAATVETLLGRIRALQATPPEVRDGSGQLLAWTRDRLQRLQTRLGRLDEQLRSEQERVRKAGHLQQELEGLEQRTADQQHRLQQRELARELLAGAIRHLSQRFNRELRDLVGRTLPLFTEGRYEHLQIDDDLTVRVFSNEKRDFLDLEEISSGTQRQIMLAVRLALAQELVNSTVEGRQFLFLDEPFAFFDQERTRQAIGVLPELSGEISQIWLVAQEFPADQTFDVPIACSRDQDSLPAV